MAVSVRIFRNLVKCRVFTSAFPYLQHCRIKSFLVKRNLHAIPGEGFNGRQMYSKDLVNLQGWTCFSTEATSWRKQRIDPKFDTLILASHGKSLKQLIIDGEANYMTCENWLSVGEELQMGDRWPFLCFNYITDIPSHQPGLFDLGKSLYDFIHHELPEKVSLVLEIQYVRLVIIQNHAPLINWALEKCREFIAMSLLNDMTAKYLLLSLDGTEHWREIIPLCHLLKKQNISLQPTYNNIIKNALRCHDHEIALEYVKRLCEDQSFISEETFRCLFTSISDQELDPFMTALQGYRESIPESLLEVLSTSLSSSSKWKLRQIALDIITQPENEIAICSNCGHPLQVQEDIDKNTFDILKDAILGDVLIERGIFYNSNPKEYESFTKFLEKEAPFDVIIDGMNVFYLSGKSAKSREIKIRQLVKACDNFKGKKILVVCHEYLKNEVKRFWKQSHTVNWYWTMALSKDDPFILHAAFHSGPETELVSNDQMRNHGSKTGRVYDFKMWQQSHQFGLVRDLYATKRNYSIKKLWQYDRHIYSTPSGWHLTTDRWEFGKPVTMWCLQKS